MRIGILETGSPPPALKSLAEPYRNMIRKMLGEAYSFRDFDATRNLPRASERLDAYFITGSASAVYSNERWIEDLIGWLQRLDRSIPLVGICFGHQIMAQAFGGRVERSDLGWMGGLQKHQVVKAQHWMNDDSDFYLPIAHEDRVVGVPESAVVLARSNSSANAVLSYRNRSAISFQGHPEFSTQYAALLVDYYAKIHMIGGANLSRAKASFNLRSDSSRIAQWIRSFIEIS